MEEQKTSKKKGCLKFFLIFLGFYFIGQLVITLTSDDKNKKTAGAEIKTEKIDTLQVINNLIALIEENKDKKYSDNPKLVGEHIALFKLSKDTYTEYQENRNEEISKKLKELKETTIKMQTKKFPEMRKNFTNTLKDKMWENNIDVIDKGTTIEMIGGFFASNKNKKEAYEQFSENLHQLRYKRIWFKWYEYDGGTYWEINSPKDSDF